MCKNKKLGCVKIRNLDVERNETQMWKKERSSDVQKEHGCVSERNPGVKGTWMCKRNPANKGRFSRRCCGLTSSGETWNVFALNPGFSL